MSRRRLKLKRKKLNRPAGSEVDKDRKKTQACYHEKTFRTPEETRYNIDAGLS
jgi:hypothetical protein